MKSNIKVPHSFFQKSKKEYNNWVFSFFRELIQNSVDAGSSDISFVYIDNEDSLTIQCTDNGSGMDRDILENVLLCLGGSKKNETSIGGFGYAKTLLFFSHDKYTIETKNHKVIGSGGEFEIFDNTFFHGTKINISMSKQDDTISYRLNETYFFEKLNLIIQNSDLKNVNIYWNNNILKNDNKKMEYKHSTDIGTLYFSDSNNNSSSIWLRINGLAMFRHHIYSEFSSHFEGYINLNKKPTDVLTTNRDSLKGEAAESFNAIIETLQHDRSSLKSEEIVNFKLNEYNINCNFNSTSDFSFSNKETMTEKNEFSSKQEKEFNIVSPFSKIQNKTKKRKDAILKIKNKVYSDKYPFNFVINKSEQFNFSDLLIKNIINQSFSIKMAYKWKFIVEQILSIVNNFEFYDFSGEKTFCISNNGNFFYKNRPIFYGFCFGDNLASNLSSDKEINILLNIEKIKKLNKDKQLNNNKLIDLAIHEIAHIFQDYHNERFTDVETSIRWLVYENFRSKDIIPVYL